MKDCVQFVQYKILLNKINRQTTALEKMHKNHLKCRNGCDLCCIDFSILPVEFYYILSELKKKNFKSNLDENRGKETCIFLHNGSCTIYEQRPIMCRTHGLPLLYANDDGEWELSACELNFTEFDFDDFTDDNTLAQDKYNSKLYLLNREFIAEFTEKKYGETDLIPLKEIGKQLFETKK